MGIVKKCHVNADIETDEDDNMVRVKVSDGGDYSITMVFSPEEAVDFAAGIAEAAECARRARDGAH